jgi:hypothetical protein
MEKITSARRITGTEELLSVMGSEEVKKPGRKPYKLYWLQFAIAFGCAFVLALGGKGFLYLNSEITAVHSAVGSAASDIDTVKAKVTANDTREQLAAVSAELDDLKVIHTQLQIEVEQIREGLQTLQAKKNNVAASPRKRK